MNQIFIILRIYEKTLENLFFIHTFTKTTSTQSNQKMIIDTLSNTNYDGVNIPSFRGLIMQLHGRIIGGQWNIISFLQYCVFLFSMLKLPLSEISFYFLFTYCRNSQLTWLFDSSVIVFLCFQILTAVAGFQTKLKWQQHLIYTVFCLYSQIIN